MIIASLKKISGPPSATLFPGSARVREEPAKELSAKIAYLEDNFKELFTTHYAGAPANSLANPQVVFEKRLGDKLLFRLECVEIGRGRPLKLVMRYIHDLTNGTWSFYSGKD